MSVELKVEEWLRKMGFDGEIPSGLSKICNPSTVFIWEQLISNVKPRQEVEKIRKNIIVNRLTKRPLEEQDQFSYPIKEIQIYMERQKLEKRVKLLESTIKEKETVIDDLLKKNKMTYVTISNIKAKIQENQERKYLLDKKAKIIEADVQRAQEVLTQARNLTPVEMDENANTEEITKTLQQCAEKLQKISEGISLSKVNKQKSFTTSIMKGPKYSSKTCTFSKYLNQSTTLLDIVTTSKKPSHHNKENIHFAKSKKCLKFTDDESDNRKYRSDTKIPKRESLGLLPEQCLNLSDEFDMFLLSSNKSDNSSLWPLPDINSESLTPCAKADYSIIEKLYSDRNLKENSKDLLYKNNRYLILTECKSIYEKLLGEIRNAMMECSAVNRPGGGVNQFDLAKLYFIHVKNELKKDKCRVVLKKLHETVRRRKEDILFQVSNRSMNKDEARRIFELRIEEAYLAGANNCLREEINSFPKIETSNKLQKVSTKIKQTKEEIVSKLECIQNLIGQAHKVLEDIKNNREETSLFVKRLGPFMRDLSWANPMKQEANIQEIEAFKKFPLEYNRKCKASQSKTLYRNISDTTIPSYIDLSSNNLEMLTILLDEPFNSAENVILNALQTKVTLNTFQSLKSQTEFEHLDYHKYTPEELSRQEEYIEPVINKLNSIINSPSVKEVLSAPNSLREITDLRVEMPFRNYISDKRLVDGHNYKFYEKILDELRNNE